MRRARRLWWVCPVLLSTAVAQPKSLPPFSHVFVLVLENTSAGDVLGNPNLPTLNALAREYGLATNYTGVAHPSLPNYVALLFGSTLGSRSDDPRQRFPGDNLALQLEHAGKTWKGYMQGLPGPGWDGPSAGTYAKKHNPLMLSSEIAGNPARARRVVPLEELDADLRSGTVPTFALIVPDLCHDLHGALTCWRGSGLERAGDAFVREWAAKIMASPAWKDHAALVITFDEGGGGDRAGGGGNVATVVVTSGGPRGVRSNRPSNHYSLLRTLEDAWGLPPLREAARATPMTDLFTR
ncbi:alkaline phosphatase family protein [Deinococcus aestuarii]|uniref:alkaline phosphatase family protein n=1 Tax=Deinococcus aestuarii TaxID=2774531 RepID=UPI001C0B6C86